MTTTSHIVVHRLIDPKRDIVASAGEVAVHVCNALGSADTVILDVSELRGLSSSFFNVVLSRVLQHAGADAVSRRVILDNELRPQATSFERSKEAVLRSVA